MGEDPAQKSRKNSQATSIKEEDKQPKKTQFQRLWEFELWNDDRTIKDLEYSQRRTEKQKLRRERKKNQRYRRWKMLYLPALFGMVGGTVLTLTATLQGLGQGTFMWDIRDVVIIFGPVVIAGGFICLMLAAGCTFQHEKEAREAVKPPEEFIGLLGFKQDVFVSRRSTIQRSFSSDTNDMPVPSDLDPNRNFIPKRARSLGSRQQFVSQSESTCSDVFVMSENSYSSTASWVKSLTMTQHQQRSRLTRQQSDSNLVSGSQQGGQTAADRRCTDDWSECADALSSQSDIQVVCMRSLTSSGYQSCASDTASISCEPRTTLSRSSSKRATGTLSSVNAYGCGAQTRHTGGNSHTIHQKTNRTGNVHRPSNMNCPCGRSVVVQNHKHPQTKEGHIMTCLQKCAASRQNGTMVSDDRQLLGESRLHALLAAGDSTAEPDDDVCSPQRTPCSNNSLCVSLQSDAGNSASVAIDIPVIVVETVDFDRVLLGPVRCTDV